MQGQGDAVYLLMRIVFFAILFISFSFPWFFRESLKTWLPNDPNPIHLKILIGVGVFFIVVLLPVLLIVDEMGDRKRFDEIEEIFSGEKDHHDKDIYIIRGSREFHRLGCGRLASAIRTGKKTKRVYMVTLRKEGFSYCKLGCHELSVSSLNPQVVTIDGDERYHHEDCRLVQHTDNGAEVKYLDEVFEELRSCGVCELKLGKAIKKREYYLDRTSFSDWLFD